MSGTEYRLTELEIALSHQEAMLEELDAVVRAQADRIDLLTRQLEYLLHRQADAETDAGPPPEANVRPPHW